VNVACRRNKKVLTLTGIYFLLKYRPSHRQTLLSKAIDHAARQAECLQYKRPILANRIDNQIHLVRVSYTVFLFHASCCMAGYLRYINMAFLATVQ